ncbi:hypothetical protein BS627_22775 [Agrobacterium salinitolerans]|jgi:hypothetical protein|uniref:Uncharacterized protein n=2 Tax=Agrobacterium TaxID=357 RepID=A0A1S7TQW4_9HYPH|nr:hypothetical protein BS627_22775 [Agrobacterium salinitolerans]OOO33809.1 hypothetical protein BTE54_09940 [Agrobacterium sp. YIC 4121]CVI56973.1 conserved hypothetical protein [Agrobacterium deltaense NCPPB 1641]
MTSMALICTCQFQVVAREKMGIIAFFRNNPDLMDRFYRFGIHRPLGRICYSGLQLTDDQER